MSMVPFPAAFKGATPLVETPRDRWECLLLVEIGNYPVLRRRLGRARAECLIHDVADAIAGLIKGAAPRRVSQQLVEIRLASDSRAIRC